jgi:hypothetical protein
MSLPVFYAIEARHLPTMKNLVWFVAIRGLADQFDAFVPRGSFVHDEGHAGQHAGKHLAGLRIVVNDQDATTTRRSGRVARRATPSRLWQGRQ